METWRTTKEATGRRSMTKLRHSDVVSGEEQDEDAGDIPIDTEDDAVIGGGGDEEETEKNPNFSDRAGPPVDDCCPICFGSFSVPCRADCGHWYCGSCILQYWNYSAASKPCKCPMCSSGITKLTPEASLLDHQEQGVTKVLETIEKYNFLFAGGTCGLVRRLCESPLFIKRIFRQIMDPDGPDAYLHEMRLFAMILSILYASTPFNFIPTGGLGIVRLFDYAAITLFLVLRLVGFLRRRRLAQRVRHMAATQPLNE